MLYKLQNLAKKSGDHFLQAFGDIPSNTSTLDASNNALRNKKADELAAAFRFIPKSITAVNLSQNGLGNDLQGDGFFSTLFGNHDKKNDIARALKHLPVRVTSLDLSDNELGNKSVGKLLKLIKALGSNLTCLNLAGNDLGHFTTHDLLALFKAMPKGLKTLDLRRTGLETKPASDLANILAQLPANIRVHLPMRKIPVITDTKPALNKFLSQVNADIEELNKLIDQFNRLTDKPGQIAALQQIFQRKQQLDNKYGDKQISLCADYRKIIQCDLFLEFQKQFAYLGINSLHEINMLDPFAKTHAEPEAGCLPEILANMAPNKAARLLEILEEGASFNKNALQNLYAATEAGYASYRRFLANNTIEFLGGKNSKNFKVIPKDASHPYVLKVENRMGVPKGMEAHLREHSLHDVLTPVATERVVTGTVLGETLTRTLLVTEFCSGGDLDSLLNKTIDMQTRLTSAISIYTQMCDILVRITRDGCGFTDMKNSNWLVDEAGTVRLADTKSLVPIKNDGQLDTRENKNRWYGFIYSKYILPPECEKTTVFSADKFHAIMLGKNLYDYLTNCSVHDLHEKHDGAKYNFNYPIFKTPEGVLLQDIVKGLIKENPDYRMSPQKALLKLQDVQTLGLKTQCRHTLKKIQTNSFNNDLIMRKFCMDMTQKIDTAKTPEDFAIIRKELDALHKDPATQSVKGIINSFRANEAWYTIGMGTKADRISDAMAKVPLEERSQVMTSKSPEARAVRMALASHRHWGRRDVYVDKVTNEVDELKAARSFHFFKAQMSRATTAHVPNPIPGF